MLADDLGLPKEIMCRDFPLWLALSDGDAMAAITSTKRGRARRLVLIDSTSGTSDFTDLATRLDLVEVERLKISASGRRLVVGTRASFLAIDLLERKVLLESAGRFPSLSPDGEWVAFVEDGFRLTVRAVSNSQRRAAASHIVCDSVGGWTPDGKYLLAGTWGKFRLERRLEVVGIEDGESAVVKKLQDSGADRLVWVSTQLLSS